MYLEISPRGSGKTHRLINRISYDFSKDFRSYAAVCTSSQRQYKHILKKLEKMGINTRDVIYYKNIKNANKKDKEIMSKNNIKYYFDEFDFIEGLNGNDIYENGYYVTTSSRERNLLEDLSGDFLFKLMRRNEGKHVSYNTVAMFGQDYYNEIIKDVNIEMEQSMFDREFLNKVFTRKVKKI